MNTVEPIRDKSLLRDILEGLEHDQTKHGKRMYLEFVTMYFTGLRVSDIIRLRKENVTGPCIYITEQKTQKQQRIPINADLRKIYDARLKDTPEDAYLFPSRRKAPDGSERHITTRQVGYDMQIIKRRFGIRFPFACHSLRKTHGYMRYKYHGDPIESLRLHFNHADEATTRRYIGIDEEERNKGLRSLHAGDYRPPDPGGKPDRKKRPESVPLEVKRQDRSENGRLWGLHKQEAARRKAEMIKAQKLKKQQKSEYDRARYQRKKAESKAKEQQRRG